MIQMFSCSLGEEELDAIRRVFESGWIGRGKVCDQFEEAFARYMGVDRSGMFMTNNATAALNIAMNYMPEPIAVPVVNFVSCGSFALNKRFVFTDVDKRTLCVTKDIMARYEDCRSVALLHYGGAPADTDIFDRYCVLEDAANALGSFWEDNIACGTRGSFGVWSFDAMKILSTIDGGMLYAARDMLFKYRDSIEANRYLGLSPSTRSGMDCTGKNRWWEYEIMHKNTGRYISNDVAAAIGIVQLRKLPAMLLRRSQIVHHYNEELNRYVAIPPPKCGYARYLYWIQTDKRDELARYLLDNGIYTTFRYYPLHKVFSSSSGNVFPNADWVADHTLCLPLHQNLTDSDVSMVVEKVKEFCNAQGIKRSIE